MCHADLLCGQSNEEPSKIESLLLCQMCFFVMSSLFDTDSESAAFSWSSEAVQMHVQHGSLCESVCENISNVYDYYMR